MKKSSHNGSSKVLIAFLAGLVIACVIIGSLLWYMNHHQTSFQGPEPTTLTPAKPERITIVDKTQPVVINSLPVASEPNNHSGNRVISTSEPLTPLQSAPTTPMNIAHQASAGIPPVSITNVPQGQNNLENNSTIEAYTENNHNKNNDINNKHDPIANILEKLESNNAVVPAPQVAKQPTAREILNGHVPNMSKSDRVVMQFGSFSQLDQAQRHVADLAKLSVRSSVIKVAVGGRTWYRVLSGTMNHNTATQLKNKLRQNQIDSLIISQH